MKTEVDRWVTKAKILLAVALMAFSVQAGETYRQFTGNGTEVRDWTDPNNWEGGVLPSEDEVAVFDAAEKTASFCSKNLWDWPCITKDFKVKGLEIKNFNIVVNFGARNGGKFYIGSAGIRTVNVGGIKLSSAPIVAVGDMDYSISGSTRLGRHFLPEISGTGTLRIGSAEATADKLISIFHDQALNHEGPVVYLPFTDVYITRNGLHSRNVSFSAYTENNIIHLTPHEDMDTSVIFPAGLTVGKGDAADPLKIKCVDCDSYYYYDPDNAATTEFPYYAQAGRWTVKMPNIVQAINLNGYTYNNHGTLELSGVSSFKNGNVDNYLVGNNKTSDTYVRTVVKPSAEVRGLNLEVGYGARWREGAEKALCVEGGTVTATRFLNVGGNACNYVNATVAQSFPIYVPAPWCEISVASGLVSSPNVLSGATTTSGGIGICATETAVSSPTSLTAAEPTTPGCFTVTGGVVQTGGLHFGNERRGHYGTAGKLTYVRDGFGAFYLGGTGVFDLGGCTGSDSDGIYLGKGWNHPDAGGSNSTYRLSLAGGRFVGPTRNALTNGLSMCFPPSGVDAEISVSKDFRQVGPIHGSGTLKKTGAGALSIADASRFTGELKVEAGMVSLDSALATCDPGVAGVDYVQFTADDLAATYADGAEVTSWPSATDASVAAGPSTLTGATATPKRIINPVFKASVFNGHAGVMFRTNVINGVNVASALEIPKEKNPLVGSTNYTLVVVLRPDNFRAGNDIGSGNTASDNIGNEIYYGMGVMGSITPTASGTSLALMNQGTPAFSVGFHDAGLVSGIGYRVAPRANVCEKGKTSVYVCTLDGPTFTLDVDGEEWSECYSLVADGMAAGTTYKRFTSSDQKSASPTRFCIGTHGGGNQLNGSCFKGYIAEVRIYPNRALSRVERKGLAWGLLKKYDATADVRAAATATRVAVPGAFQVAPAPALPDGATAYDAEALYARTEKVGSPTLVTDAVNSKSVVRFAGSDALKLASADSPVGGKTSFAAAVVFKTTVEGSGENGYAVGSGLVSTWQGGTADADWAMSFRRYGVVGAGTGNPTGAQYCNEFKPARLADGLAHVSVFSVDAAARKMNLMTDGRLLVRDFFAATTSFAARGAYATRVGALGEGSGFFVGDIAEVVFYDRALTEAEMTRLSEALAAKYAFRLLDKAAYGATASTGLGAKKISVAANAKLVLPESDTSPLTLGKDGELTVAGSILGSIRIGAGAAFNAADSTGIVDDLQFQGGKFIATSAGPVHIASRMSGAADLVFAGEWAGGEPPQRYVFATFDDYDDVKDVTWTSSQHDLSRVIVDRENGCLKAVFKRGMLLIVR